MIIGGLSTVLVATLLLVCIASFSSAGVVPADATVKIKYHNDGKNGKLKFWSKNQDNKEWQQLQNEINDIPNEKEIASLKNWRTNPQHDHRLTELLHYFGPDGDVRLSLSCLACKFAVKILREMIAKGASHDTIGRLVTHICRLFHVEAPDVCTGLVREYRDEVIEVLSNITWKVVSPNYVCGIVTHSSCSGVEPDWNVTLPNIPKPPVIPPALPSPGSPKLRVLHLTDIHVDFLYQPGSNPNCGKPLCCHDKRNSGGVQAGKWGDYGTCDIPPWTVEHLFRNLSQTENFDYILWTGDLPSHQVWNQTREGQLDSLKYLTELLLKFFPTTPVYSAVGNHESAPVNSFPPLSVKGNQSASWLYDGLHQNWMHWLPNSTTADITRGGFYTVLVRPGFRIISINNNFCNQDNWWLFLNSTDPADELAWLISVLQTAENNREKVHIIGHIPTCDPGCLRIWSRNYHRIVQRYEGIIAGQFFGHKHFDTWELFYDDQSKRPVSVAYAAPSLTTYMRLNPGYRVYEVDGLYPNSSWMVLDHETFIMNLTESNLRDEPVWLKEYSVKSAYNMSSLTSKDWSDLSERLRNDQKLFEKYRLFYYKSYPYLDLTCNEKCRDTMLCELSCGSTDEARPCSHLRADDEGAEELAVNYIRWTEEKRIC